MQFVDDILFLRLNILLEVMKPRIWALYLGDTHPHLPGPRESKSQKKMATIEWSLYEQVSLPRNLLRRGGVPKQLQWCHSLAKNN